MNESPAHEPTSTEAGASQTRAPHGLRWWLHVVEVRLRFVLLVLAALVVVSQWNRIRGVWDDWWHAVQGQRAPASVSADLEYFCPMDPGVVSVWPAVCPICNMDLVQRRRHDAQLLPEGVVSRMQFSPYRIQLAGIRTARVEPRPLEYELVLSGVLGALDRTGEEEQIAEPQDRSSRLFFDAPISRQDAGLLTRAREATIFQPGLESLSAAGMAELLAALNQAPANGSGGNVPIVRVMLSDEAAPGAFSAGLSVRAVVRVPAGELLKAESATGAMSVADAGPGETEAIAVSGADSVDSTDSAVLAVLESALVQHGRRRFVFVESMPGTFDAVEVSVGRRSGDFYPVISGLKAGQHVAVAGAFLIDAEARLNPSLAVSYFGANQSNVERGQPELRLAREPGAGTRLSPEEQALAARQGTCPVTGLSLDAMGGPVPVLVAGRKVFICCRGCEGKLKSDPARYLARLGPQGSTDD